jgi:hypothetical protein
MSGYHWCQQVRRIRSHRYFSFLPGEIRISFTFYKCIYTGWQFYFQNSELTVLTLRSCISDLTKLEKKENPKMLTHWMTTSKILELSPFLTFISVGIPLPLGIVTILCIWHGTDSIRFHTDLGTDMVCIIDKIECRLQLWNRYRLSHSLMKRPNLTLWKGVHITLRLTNLSTIMDLYFLTAISLCKIEM